MRVRELLPGDSLVSCLLRLPLPLPGAKGSAWVFPRLVATAMGVSQARVSKIENGQLERSEVDTLAAYVKALGGKRRIIADFGDGTYVLG